ncbi:ExbD/TolR family protein [Anaerosinus massiliensis]|uniref:ExbD/TolR family protein n=1 Tax=Massilibacillus massiliensis TaxID=1806837 RepID=UPI000A94F7E4|nr:biopolymer transporter ExbD [Massilibacillus massiliensis]
MKLRNLRSERSPKLMIIPMIDIIFFLLVFFMMSTLYRIEQNLVPMQLPYASAQKAQTDHSISVTVLPNGNILFENEEIVFAVLGQMAKSELRKNKESIFVLKADKKTEYGEVVAALDELKSAGISKIAIATERKER